MVLINHQGKSTPLIYKNMTMEIDINVAVYDLLWRLTSLGTKKAYREAYGAARDRLVSNELQRLIEAGYVVKSGSDAELTPAGKELH